MILLWDICPIGEVPVAYRVEYVHRVRIGTMFGLDDQGNVVEMPIYSPWVPVHVQTSPEQQADVPCDPAPGEVCVGVVTSLDEYGMEDDGTECETQGGTP